MESLENVSDKMDDILNSYSRVNDSFSICERSLIYKKELQITFIYPYNIYILNTKEPDI